MPYSTLVNTLKSVLAATYHLKAPRSATRHIVWAEAGSHSAFGDGRRGLTAFKASVYIYTQTEGDTLPGDVVAALENAGMAVGDPIPDYDDETETMSWILECEVI
jgi:hypothetical protein